MVFTTILGSVALAGVAGLWLHSGRELYATARRAGQEA